MTVSRQRLLTTNSPSPVFSAWGPSDAVVSVRGTSLWVGSQTDPQLSLELADEAIALTPTDSGAVMFVTTKRDVVRIHLLDRSIERIGHPPDGRPSRSLLFGDDIGAIVKDALWAHAETSGWGLIARFRGDRLTAAARLPDGGIAVGTAEGKLHLSTSGGWRALWAHSDQVTDMVVTENLTTVSRDATVAVWTFDGEWKELRRLALPGHGFLNRVARTARDILVASSTGTVIRLDGNGRQKAIARLHSDSIRTLLLNRRGRMILTTGDDGDVVVATSSSLAVRSRMHQPSSYHRASTTSVVERDVRVVVGRSDGSVTSYARGRRRMLRVPGDAGIRALATLPHGGFVYGTDDGRLGVQRGARPKWEIAVADRVTAIAVDEERGRLLVGLACGDLAVVDPRTGNVERSVHIHDELIGDILVARDVIATCSDDRSVNFLSRVTAQPIRRVTADGALALNNLAFAGRRLLASSDDGSVVVIDVERSTIATRVTVHDHPVRALSASENEVFTGDRMGVVRLWSLSGVDTARGWRLTGQASFGDRVISLTRTPEGSLIVATEREVSEINPEAIRGRRPSGVTSVHPPSSDSSETILHLSDIHCTGDIDAVESSLSAMVEDLRRELRIEHAGVVVVSGDVTQTASDEEFLAAERFMRLLCNAVTPDHVVVVPGNHDLSWVTTRKAYGDPPAGPVPTDPVDTPVGDVDAAKFERFAAWHQAVTGRPYSIDPREQYCVVDLPGVEAAICGLNSAWAIDHRHLDRANLHPVAIARVLDTIRRSPELSQHRLILAAWHHPMAGRPDDAPIGNPEILDQLAKANFRFVLHGHVHRPDFKLRPFDIAGARGLTSLGVGTFGAPVRAWHPGFPLGYQVFTLSRSHLTVISRKREFVDGPWLPDARWRHSESEDPISSMTFARGASPSGVSPPVS